MLVRLSRALLPLASTRRAWMLPSLVTLRLWLPPTCKSVSCKGLEPRLLMVPVLTTSIAPLLVRRLRSSATSVRRLLMAAAAARLRAASPLASTWVLLPSPVIAPALLVRLIVPLACNQPTLMERAVVRLRLPRVVRRSARVTLWPPLLALPSICRLRSPSPSSWATRLAVLRRVREAALSASRVRLLATTVDGVTRLSLLIVSAS